MARELVGVFPSAADAMAEADQVLGFPLSTLCFDGPAEVLTDTINAQPALLAAGVATLRAVAEAIPELPAPVAAAGHSMGEYSALVAAGALSFADGLRLVRERGRLMKEAGESNPGGMAAILGLDTEQVATICAAARDETGGVVQIANDNCPGQVVISGDTGSLEVAMAKAGAAGAHKVVRLAVSIAAHSPLMAPVASALRQAVAATEIRDPQTQVISNITARPFTGAGEIREELAAQLTEPVRWSQSMHTLVGLGVDAVVELGPGNVLSALMKRIDRQVSRLAVGDPAGVAALKESLGA
jgi:[acyl-carrier-protein] S-malonyltransferase